MKIGILSYGAGNIASVKNSLNRLGINSFLSSSPQELMMADKLIFPGVGHATLTMQNIERNGLDRLLKEYTNPILGICLGMQLMGSNTEEGPTNGLGMINFRVKLFGTGLKVPHMGWNSITPKESPLFKGIPCGSFFYFVHSFYGEVCQNTIASCNYGIDFTAAVAHGSQYGVQFHPEKSGDAGMEVLRNFVQL